VATNSSRRGACVSLGAVAHPAFSRIAPFAIFIAFIVAQSVVGDSPWLVVARGVATAVVLAIFWRGYVELKARPRAREVVLAVVVGLFVFAVWITADDDWATLGREGPGFVPLGSDGRIDWMLAGMRLAGLALVVPIAEELFWRSFFLRWIDTRDFLALEPRRVSLTAIALSCALFSVEHSLWFAGLLAGLAYTWLYLRSGNLWISIISHAITNGTLGLWILATGNWRYW
jgi:CAAX prenyl protease-like protein